MDEERLIEIETRIAFQEETLKELNAVVFDQQKEIDRLRKVCELLVKRTKAIADFAPGSDGPADEKPPHY